MARRSYDEIDVEVAAGILTSGKNADHTEFFVTAGALDDDGAPQALTVDEDGALLVNVGGGISLGDVTVGALESIGEITSPVTVVTGEEPLSVVATQTGVWSVVADAPIAVTDNDATLSIDDGDGSITVDGTVAATQSGTWDVNVTNELALAFPEGAMSVDDNGGSLTVDGTVAATQSGDWEVTVLNSLDVAFPEGAISVDDNGGSLTVDGTVAATQSGTWDIGTVTGITNVVHVDDNAGSLTVDGTVGVSGTVTVDSELPSAATLVDNTATPTAPAVGAFGMVYDGANWDMARGTAADGMFVKITNPGDISSGGGAVTIADGSDSATGAKADAAYTSGSGSVISVLKGIFGKIPALGQATKANSLPVTLASDQGTLAVAATPGLTTTTITWTSGQSTSSTVTNAGYASGLIVIPATFTGTYLQLQVSSDNSTWSSLFDDSGNSLSFTVTTGTAYAIPQAAFAAPYFRFVTASNQASGRTVTLFLSTTTSGPQSVYPSIVASSSSFATERWRGAAAIGDAGAAGLGGVAAALYNGSTWDRARTTAGFNDGNTTGLAAVGSYTYGAFLDSGGWNRFRGNDFSTPLSSSARTATTSSSAFRNFNYRGYVIFLNVTAMTASPSLVLTFEAQQNLNTAYSTILTSAAVTSTGMYRYVIYPGISETANVKVSDIPSAYNRITVTHGNTDSATYSVQVAGII